MCSLPEYSALAPTLVEIGNNEEGAPFIRLPDGVSQPGCLSISHSGGQAFCAFSFHPSLRLGADLERLEPRPESVIHDYFTPGEQRLAAAQPEAATLIWSLKESMLKALGTGLRVDTRRVEALCLDGDQVGGWRTVRVTEAGMENRPWRAWWQRRGDFVLTMTAFAAGEQEISLVEQSASLTFAIQ